MGSDQQPRYELNRLATYGDDDLIRELQRVAALLSNAPTLTRSAFDQISLASSSVFVRRFGGWREALSAAGLEGRYSGRTVNDRMRQQMARGVSNAAMIDELRRVAELLGTTQLSRHAFDAASTSVRVSAVERRFGSWRAAIDAAGLEVVPHGRRWTTAEYFGNLLDVWTAHGRQPKYREMDAPPSRISSGAYEAKFGTWTKALLSFIEHMNNDDLPNDDEPIAPVPTPARTNKLGVQRTADTETIGAGLRYRVLRRDHFRCALCGASPAITRGIVLHVDHVVARARGGKTTEENLRTLCQDCNLGKGSKVE